MPRDYQLTQRILRREMEDNTIPIADEIFALQRKLAVGRVLIDYDVGLRIKTVWADEAEYGSDVVAQIASYVNYRGGPPALYRLLRMVREFPREFVKHQAGEPMVDGRFLETGHFVAVASFENRREQLELFQRIRSECMSVRRVTGLVRQRRPSRRRAPSTS